MSSRALRKAQKQQEEERLRQQTEEEEDAASEGDPRPANKTSMFAMLNQAEDEEEDKDDDVDTPVPEHDSTTEIVQPVSTPKSISKKKRKKKAKALTPAPESEQDFDLPEVAKPVSNEDAAPQIPTSLEELCKLLSVAQQNLHVLNEMRNLFGRDVIEAEERQLRGEAARAARRGRQGVNDRLAAISRRRNIFIQGRERWSAVWLEGQLVSSGGLGMEVVERRSNGIVEYRFTHSIAYQDVQRQFEICVHSMDPQRMIALLQHNPWHIATLLQVSDIAKQSRQHSDAGELLERALFSFGRAIHSTFAQKLSEGKARLDFRRPENREFWLASWRYIDNLRMRATWRTVYEWTKMLLGLDPERDPYSIKLVIDQFAIRARQQQHFLDLTDNSHFDQALCSSFGLDPPQSSVPNSDEKSDKLISPGLDIDAEHESVDDPETLRKSSPGRLNLTVEGIPYPLVNILATRALAKFQVGKSKAAEFWLKEAMEICPWLFASLFHELQIEPIPPSIWGKQPPGPNEDLASKLYASRAKDIWNTPESMGLLIKVAKNLKLESWKPYPEPPVPLFEQQGPVRHVILHMMLTEQPQFIGLLPTQPTNEQLRTSDPYPPLNNLSSYDAQPSGGFTNPLPENMADQLRVLEEQLRRVGLIDRERNDQGTEHDDGDELPDLEPGNGDGTEPFFHVPGAFHPEGFHIAENSDDDEVDDHSGE